MIIGSPFAKKKFDKAAREGGDTGIVCELGYVVRQTSYGRAHQKYTYMGFPMYCFFRTVEGSEKPLGLWAAPIRCVHEWYVLVCETRNGLQDLIKEWRRLNPDDA